MNRNHNNRDYSVPQTFKLVAVEVVKQQIPIVEPRGQLSQVEHTAIGTRLVQVRRMVPGRHHARVAVLVVATTAHQVPQQATDPPSPGNLRNHRLRLVRLTRVAVAMSSTRPTVSSTRPTILATSC